MESMVDKIRDYSNQFNAYVLDVREKFYITGRGDVWVIELEKNSLPLLRKDWKNMMGWYIREAGSEDIYEVRGIEARGIPEHCEHREIGLLLRKVKTDKND
jgi:hypothetical protein